MRVSFKEKLTRQTWRPSPVSLTSRPMSLTGPIRAAEGCKWGDACKGWCNCLGGTSSDHISSPSSPRWEPSLEFRKCLWFVCTLESWRGYLKNDACPSPPRGSDLIGVEGAGHLDSPKLFRWFELEALAKTICTCSGLEPSPRIRTALGSSGTLLFPFELLGLLALFLISGT